MSPTPEFLLLAQCCRAGFVVAPPTTSEPNTGVDWPLFARLARFHRVQGLSWDALAPIASTLPERIAEALSGEARDIAAKNLRIVVECAEIRAQFEAANIRLLFLKGLTVAALAYRNPLLKMSWDIDVLIDPAQLSEAVQLLRGRGYRLTIPSGEERLSNWHRRRKESVWSRDDGLTIELHTRLSDNPALIPNIGVHSPGQEATVAPGMVLATLGTDELFAYLCVHGASSAWFRLKWISDLAGLVSDCSAQEIQRLYRRSQELGAERSAGQALLLADRLFGTLDGTELAAELRAGRPVRLLADSAYNQLAGRAAPKEPTEVLLGTWRIHLSQLFLRPGLRFKAGEIVRQFRDAVG